MLRTITAIEEREEERGKVCWRVSEEERQKKALHVNAPRSRE